MKIFRDDKEKTVVMIGLVSVAVAAMPFIIIAFILSGNRKAIYKSPEGTKRITVKYDFVSRPSVIYKGDKIWEYEGAGFMEDVSFEVEWLSENSFLMKYNDEMHDGEFAEEFEITLPQGK